MGPDHSSFKDQSPSKHTKEYQKYAEKKAKEGEYKYKKSDDVWPGQQDPYADKDGK